MYNKIHRESFQQNILRRNNFINSGNLINSNNYARYLGIQSSGFPAQPTNRNQTTTTISRSGTVKPPSARPFPPINNAYQPKRSCENYRGDHIIATCPDYQKCSPRQRFDSVIKSNLCLNETLHWRHTHFKDAQLRPDDQWMQK